MHTLSKSIRVKNKDMKKTNKRIIIYDQYKPIHFNLQHMQGKQQRQLPKMHLKFIPTKSLLNSPQTLKNQLCLLAFTAHLWIYSDI